MSGKKSLFASAPRMVIGIRTSSGFHKVAYAIGLSVNVSTTVQPVYVIGDFGPVSYEPTQYQPVTGSFQVVRLQTKTFRDARVTNSKTLYGAESKILTSSTIRNSVGGEDNNVLANGLWDHLNPTRVLLSESFDIEIYMNVTGYGHAIDDTGVANFNAKAQTEAAIKAWNAAKARDAITGLSTAGIEPAAYDTTVNPTPTLLKLMTLMDCRITSRNINLAQGQLVNEPLNFMGLLAKQRDEALDSVIQEKAV